MQSNFRDLRETNYSPKHAGILVLQLRGEKKSGSKQELEESPKSLMSSLSESFGFLVSLRPASERASEWLTENLQASVPRRLEELDENTKPNTQLRLDSHLLLI